MNILVLNGSPKGEKSNTFKLTTAFLKGLGDGHNIDIVNIRSMNINHCNGCFACWNVTPGKCVIDDDMNDIIEKYIKADIIIWSFPLYYYSMPSKIKAVLDRLLPTNLPFISTNADGSNSHPDRYDLSHQKYILISTCGFYSTTNNYDALYKQFEILYKNNFEKIICTEGELFRVPQLSNKTDEYLDFVTLAGTEYSNNFCITEDTHAKLSQLLYEPEIFVQMADASWNIPQNDIKQSTPITPQDNSVNSNTQSANIELDNFMKQMSLIYNNPNGKEDTILEMYFTDKNKTYQLLLNDKKCTMKSDNFSKYTTRIETTFALWQQISSGAIDGASALMEGKYKVLGDFKFMLRMDELFGTKKKTKEEVENKSARHPKMIFLLAPWIALWSLLPVNAFIGGIVAILLCVLIPILNVKFTIYDKLSLPVVTTIALLAILQFNLLTLVILSYALFGAFWLISTFKKIPLSAHYSCYEFGGENAISNPLFIKTNRILSFMWAITYFILTLFAAWLMFTPLHAYTGAFLIIGPALMGIFTHWFKNWYPAHIARG